MGLITSVKTKFLELAAKNLAKSAERGEYGRFIQSLYVATKGYKALIGTTLFVATQAVGQFSPPWADSYVRFAGIATGVLAAIGWLDKARRNEPLFEPWFLEALATVSGWIAAGSTVVLGISSTGLLGVLFPGQEDLRDQINIYATALTTATAFLNRLCTDTAAPVTQ